MNVSGRNDDNHDGLGKCYDNHDGLGRARDGSGSDLPTFRSAPPTYPMMPFLRL